MDISTDWTERQARKDYAQHAKPSSSLLATRDFGSPLPQTTPKKREGNGLNMEPAVGFEPTTDGLQIHNRHFATMRKTCMNAA
jgi:hypothetical protein